MAEIICAREFAKSKLRQERERFACALEDKRVEGLCYQWLRTIVPTKSFAECQKMFDTFIRTYYMSFTYDNTHTSGRFIDIMSTYMDNEKKKTRKMFDEFSKEMKEYCHSVLGRIMGGTKNGIPIIFNENADDTWWHYDDCPPSKKHKMTWKSPIVTEEGIWSGMTRCPANKTCPGHPDPPAYAILRQKITAPMKKILQKQHRYVIQLAKLGPVADMEHQMCLDYWGECDTVVGGLRLKIKNLERRLSEEMEKVNDLEDAEQRHINQSEKTIRNLENDVSHWHKRTLELEHRSKQLQQQCRLLLQKTKTAPRGQPPPVYGQPPSVYGQRPPVYGQRPPVYGQRPPVYGRSSVYGQPPPVYGQSHYPPFHTGSDNISYERMPYKKQRIN